jgi:hypothetical protein
MWLRNGNSFWFYPTLVGRQSVVGFLWIGNNWLYQRIPFNRIRNFRCF